MPVLNQVAQVAEIQAAKHNWELIPMCHPLPLTGIDSSFHLSDQPCMVEIRAAVTCIGVTGVDSATPEMCGQVIYPAAVMQGGKEEAAQAFLDYLQTDAAMTVFESVGFSAA